MVSPVNPICQEETGTIASGASLSASIPLQGRTLAGVYFPSWTAAVLTFQASHDGTTWYDVRNEDGTEYTLTAAANSYIGCSNAVPLFGAQFLKVRSGTASSVVNQGADRDLILMLAAIG